MKLHFDGLLPVGYWGDEYPKDYNPEWIAFTCAMEKQEVVPLEEYLCRLHIPYRLHVLSGGPFYTLSMPSKDAIRFRMIFPAPSSCSGPVKDFAEYFI